MDFGPEYANTEIERFRPKYSAACRCGRVRYAVRADPVDAKICHCRDCQIMHGAPMQWAAIFHKRDVCFLAGVDCLRFYNVATGANQRSLPCKVSCRACGTLIADEGRRMWLAFPSLFDFGIPSKPPPAFAPTCHIFYGARVVDMNDRLPKWAGHKGKSARLD